MLGSGADEGQLRENFTKKKLINSSKHKTKGGCFKTLQSGRKSEKYRGRARSEAPRIRMLKLVNFLFADNKLLIDSFKSHSFPT